MTASARRKYATKELLRHLFQLRKDGRKLTSDCPLCAEILRLTTPLMKGDTYRGY